MLEFGYLTHFERTVIEELRRIAAILGDIRENTTPKQLSGARITLMPKSIVVGGTASAVIAGFDQFGKPFPISSSDSVTLQASTAADVTFGSPSFNADGTVTVSMTGVNPDDSDSITAVVADPTGTVTSSADVLTITAPAPVLTTATLTLQ